MGRLLLALPPRFLLRHATTCIASRKLYSSSTSQTFNRKADPLRILFCGSDTFSIVALRPLVRLLETDPSIVESIDVLCRPPKRTGQGLKVLKEPPVGLFAKTANLPLYELNHFDHFNISNLSGVPNIIIAVSFGLLIPGEIIETAKYGGLNVHPSLLPDLPGAAPLHHTILNRRTWTGVTVQTLHPTKFDRGELIAQTPLPGIPVPRDATPDSLRYLSGLEAGHLLRKVVEEKLFVDPINPVVHTKAQLSQITDGKEIAKASKLSKESSRIDWKEMTAAEITLALQVFGRVWEEDILVKRAKFGLESKPWRAVYHDLRDISNRPRSYIPEGTDLTPGSRFLVPSNHPESPADVVVATKEGGLIQIIDCTVAGLSRGEHSMRRLRKPETHISLIRKKPSVNPLDKLDKLGGSTSLVRKTEYDIDPLTNAPYSINIFRKLQPSPIRVTAHSELSAKARAGLRRKQNHLRTVEQIARYNPPQQALSKLQEKQKYPRVLETMLNDMAKAGELEMENEENGQEQKAAILLEQMLEKMSEMGDTFEERQNTGKEQDPLVMLQQVASSKESATTRAFMKGTLDRQQMINNWIKKREKRRKQ
ncbi:Formyltransferase [Microthyrium microscopicum]|uniref:methionyl-tRNA formyltransferase n=1 Tax=Microthyrium microscopicum TaxID=703497 RepID=A0A6A6U380_9PEZI|nr:Formyltransferase [Microthyrium microscopicum]